MTAEEVKAAEREKAAHLFTTHLAGLLGALEFAEKDPGLAAEGLEDQGLADATAALQDARSRLQMVERDLVVELGKRHGKFVGALSDGRQFKLERGSDRKEWQHDDWKRDVRRAIVQAIPAGLVLLDTDSGEEAPMGPLVQELLAQAQSVHGAQAPKSTALKPLGLYATDYCTSTPAGWRFTAVAPTVTTTTEETTNG